MEQLLPVLRKWFPVTACKWKIARGINIKILKNESFDQQNLPQILLCHNNKLSRIFLWLEIDIF